ncbi:MAG TPA: 30S ribosomal protein S14 [Oligoflexia bacterium]|nr:30S ribosomal protein S14 [Oligoflexia bacterium]HMP26850.1 30S ribosomal protein S14 [Oligoflexia bacterium]
MAKKSTLHRNKLRIEREAKGREKRSLLRAQSLDLKLSFEERMMARQKLQALPRDTSSTRIRNRCQITGRPRGVYREFMLSRIMFREMAHSGLIPGVTKSSW